MLFRSNPEKKPPKSLNMSQKSQNNLSKALFLRRPGVYILHHSSWPVNPTLLDKRCILGALWLQGIVQFCKRGVLILISQIRELGVREVKKLLKVTQQEGGETGVPQCSFP